MDIYFWSCEAVCCTLLKGLVRQSVTHFVLPTHLCGISISFSSYVRQSVAHFVLFLCGLFVFLFVGLLFFFFFSSVYVSQSVTRFSLVL